MTGERQDNFIREIPPISDTSIPLILNGLASLLVGQLALGTKEVARITDHVFWPKLFNWNLMKSLEPSLVYRKLRA